MINLEIEKATFVSCEHLVQRLVATVALAQDGEMASEPLSPHFTDFMDPRPGRSDLEDSGFEEEQSR